ncbi:MAG: hypothetical protein K5870_11505 [Lachnospiraceae bacterium]|nr:hypothetical protein [Lachnospiraceae bacterium]
MEEQMFRKKAMDRISSPEDLHDYIRVTSPRLWMLLSAILVLLVGFIIYGATATIDNTVQVKLTVENFVSGDAQDEMHTVVYGNLPSTYHDLFKPGMTVRLGGEEGRISSVYDIGDGQITLMCEMSAFYLPIPAGEYDAEIVVESTTPLSFLWN